MERGTHTVIHTYTHIHRQGNPDGHTSITATNTHSHTYAHIQRQGHADGHTSIATNTHTVIHAYASLLG